MTLIEYFALTREVKAASARLSEAVESAESDEEVELLGARLKLTLEALSNAKCPGASSSDVAEVKTLTEEGSQLLNRLRSL